MPFGALLFRLLRMVGIRIVLPSLPLSELANCCWVGRWFLGVLVRRLGTPETWSSSARSLSLAAPDLPDVGARSFRSWSAHGCDHR